MIRKILIVVDTVIVGGAEKLAATLAKGFIERGYDSMILVLPAYIARTDMLFTSDDSHPIQSVDSDKTKVGIAFRKFRFDVSYLLKIRKLIQNYQPDVILCQARYSYFSVKMATLLTNRIPMHLALHYTNNVRPKDDIFDALYFYLLKMSKDNIISIYKRQTDIFSDKYNIPKKRFVCIHNGVDTDYFRNSSDFRAANRPFNIVHIANIREEKDQWTLLHALKILDRYLKEWRLVFCGRDLVGLRGEFERYLQAEGIDSKVKFLDYVNNVKSVLEKADVFVLSSTSEALPVASLEALAMGVPCVLTDVGGCSDLVEDGVNGFLVPSRNPESIAEKILILSRHRGQLVEMSRAARRKATGEFDLDKTISGYLNAFQRSYDAKV